MIRTEHHDSIAVVALEHGKVNAIDAELFAALDETLQQLAAAETRGIVLTGYPTVFSAGVDLFRVLDADDDYLERFLPLVSQVLRTMMSVPVPIVGALGGHAIAGGYLLAAACDRRLMATGKGRVGVPELAVGVPFPGLALGLLQALVPAHASYELVTSGRLVGAEEAKALGLVDELVEPDALHERALAVAGRLAAIPTASFALTKSQLREPLLEADYTNVDQQVLAAWSSAEVQKAMRAYLDKAVGKKG